MPPPIRFAACLLVAALCPPAHAARDGETLRTGAQSLLVTHAGQRREAIVHVPARAAVVGRAVPLVVALHGGGGSAAHMAGEDRYGLLAKADREGFVVVFPNGTSRPPGGRFATWNAGGCCGHARDSGADDVGFVRATVAAVRARVAIDGGRIFATGMSNGGMLAHRLACDAADLFRAVAAVAGTDGTLACTPVRPVSVLHVHARDDTHVRFDGGAGPDAFRDDAKVMDFVSVPETIARWVRRNRCAAPPQHTSASKGAACETYAPCADGTTVRLCVTDDGGHAWPGAPWLRRGKTRGTHALVANDVIWDFFAAAAGPR